MNKKNFALFIASITCILLVFNPSWVNGVDLTLTDPIQDISHWVDGVEIATNLATPTEIDIVSMEMNESIVAVTFVDTPVLHIDNFYDFIVYWNGDQNVNFTDGHWNAGNIISQTKLVNSTGDIIVNTISNTSIELIGNTIYYSILNASLIVTDMDPINMIMDARQRSGPGAEFYQDTLEYNTNTGAVPGYTIAISIIGITTIVVTFITQRKKR
ncbi:MAG: hypothetical protein ACTSSB_14440 [Candidatus Heimdallarchaeota archaeon]